MAWVAADRAVKAVEQADMEGPVDRWRAVRDEIRRDIMTKGFDEERNTFTQYYGSQELDAALLMMPLVGSFPRPISGSRALLPQSRRSCCRTGSYSGTPKNPAPAWMACRQEKGRSSPARSG